MHTENSRPRHSKTLAILLIGICFILAPTLMPFLFPTNTFAAVHKTLSPKVGPSFHASVGFDSRYRDNHWIPIQVTLQNNGPDFNGKISVDIPEPFGGTGNTTVTSHYQKVVSLPTGAQKQVTLYIPVYIGSEGTTQTINVNLLDDTGQKISTQTTPLRSLGSGDIFIGILSNQSSGFGALSQASLPSQTASTIVEPLNATTMPTVADALNNFDVIILDNFTTSSLNKDQLLALENWVRQGGTLITVGGPEWRRTLSPLPADLLPVNITGTGTLPTNTHLLPVGGPTKGGPDENKVSDAIPSSVPVSTARTSTNSTTILNADNTPLIVQSQRGQGNVYYLAFDPALEPVTDWSSASYLWEGLLMRSMGDQLLQQNQNPNISIPLTTPWKGGSGINIGNWESLLQALFPNAFPATGLILILLLSYIAILGPIRLILVRTLKRRDWSWRIVLSTIVVFSLLSYGLALQQKGTSVVSSNVSVIQFDQAGPNNTNTPSHVTTYLGVFVPSQGNFQVHIDGDNLVESTSDQTHVPKGIGSTPYNSQPTTITSTENGTNADLQGVDIWTMRSLVIRHDSQIKGTITSNLTIQNGTLTGSVTNTLPYALNDVYVLLGNQYQSLGHLAAGQTQTVDLSLNTSAVPSNPPQSIADQIASSHGLPAPYEPYYGNQQTQNSFEQHMEMLSTLSGEYTISSCGSACNQLGVSVSNSSVARRSYSSGRDALLIPGSAATLIAWPDNQLDTARNITINGSSSNSVQETLIQAPLNVNFQGSVQLPSSLIRGNLVDIQNQGSNIQTLFPDTYTMTTGSMTFEFTVPNIANFNAGGLTFSEPQILNAVGAGQPSGSMQGDIGRLHTYLYNWHTGTWDAFTFHQNTLSLNNAQPYVDANGHILIQFANQDSTLGTTLLSKPLVELQGTISR